MARAPPAQGASLTSQSRVPVAESCCSRALVTARLLVSFCGCHFFHATNFTSLTFVVLLFGRVSGLAQQVLLESSACGSSRIRMHSNPASASGGASKTCRSSYFVSCALFAPPASLSRAVVSLSDSRVASLGFPRAGQSLQRSHLRRPLHSSLTCALRSLTWPGSLPIAARAATRSRRCGGSALKFLLRPSALCRGRKRLGPGGRSEHFTGASVGNPRPRARASPLEITRSSRRESFPRNGHDRSEHSRCTEEAANNNSSALARMALSALC